MPGPSATALVRAACAMISPTDPGPKQPSRSVTGAHMTSRIIGAINGWTDAGTAATTRPAPARRPAWAHSTPAPVSPGAPATTSTEPAPYFSPAAALAGICAAAAGPASQARGSARTPLGDPDVDHHNLTGTGTPGLDVQARLVAVVGHGQIRRNAGTGHVAGVRVDAGGHVKRDDRARPARGRVDDRVERRPRRTARAGAQQPVDEHRPGGTVRTGIKWAEGGAHRQGDVAHHVGVGCRGRGTGGGDDLHAPARLGQVPGNDHAVAPVVAGADEHDCRARAGQRAESPGRSIEARALHQDDRREPEPPRGLLIGVT